MRILGLMFVQNGSGLGLWLQLRTWTLGFKGVATPDLFLPFFWVFGEFYQLINTCAVLMKLATEKTYCSHFTDDGNGEYVSRDVVAQE